MTLQGPGQDCAGHSEDLRYEEVGVIGEQKREKPHLRFER